MTQKAQPSIEPGSHYVDNKKFLAELIEFKKQVDHAKRSEERRVGKEC